MTDLYRFPKPEFDSTLMRLLFEVERLRADIGTGTTPVDTYIELHRLFDMVMSVVSARIEGNHTTVYEAVEASPATERPDRDEHWREVSNILAAARALDDRDPQLLLTHSLVRELHERTVTNLTREGDPTPGDYRSVDVAITGSQHRPPSWVTVHAEISDLLDFANQERPPHEQMMQIALAHHRFVWIHPFQNGNGRVSRLFTYAMLRRTIFATGGHSALNPTSVFGNDRSAYISALEAADRLDDAGALEWSEFFVHGIRDDLSRIVRLQDHEYVVRTLVGPALDTLARDGLIDPLEHRVLMRVLIAGTVKAGDLESDVAGSASRRSRLIRTLLDRSLLTQADEGPRFYRLSLARGPIAGRLIRRLDDLGMLPKMLSDD